MTEATRPADDFRKVLPELLLAYEDCPHVLHVDHCPLPSRDAVVRILNDLHEILFPGFGRRQGLERATLDYHVGDVLLGLREDLTEQISRAIRHERPREACSLDEYRIQARDLADAYLARLPIVVRLLDTDVRAAYDGDPAARSTSECISCYPGVEAVAVYRLAHELLKLGVPLLPRLMTEHAHAKTGIDIHPGANIGPSFFIDHGTGVVIGETCEIGRGVKLYQGVTLGALSFPRDETGKIIRGQKRHPTLEDFVVVYANATILGGDTVIGEHSVVGSSVWLMRSVDPHTMVTMRSPDLQFRDGQKRA